MSLGSRLLGDARVQEVRARYAAGGITHRELAIVYGCSRALISKLCLDVSRRAQPCPICPEGSGKSYGHRGGHALKVAPPAFVLKKNYPHGTNARYHLQRCRCRPCRAAATAYQRRRNRLRLYGQWDSRIDAEAARTHLRRLGDMGIGPKSVTKACGVPASSLARIMGARTGSRDAWEMARYRPIHRVRRSTSDRICAVMASEARAPGSPVTQRESDVARQRVQDLVAHGMRKWEIAVHLNPRKARAVAQGKRPGLQVDRHPTMHRKTVDGIADLYFAFFRARRMATPEEQRTLGRAA
jgi:hypothetical protein